MPKITADDAGPTYADDPPDGDVVWHDPPDDEPESDDPGDDAMRDADDDDESVERPGSNESGDDGSAVWVGDDETLTKVDPTETEPASDELRMPERGAPKVEWVKYAKARGWSDADVNGMTRQELITAFVRPETR